MREKKEERRGEKREEKREEQIDTIIKKIRKGRNLSETAEEMEKDQEMIRPVWEAVKAQAPEYDREKIFRSLLK